MRRNASFVSVARASADRERNPYALSPEYRSRTASADSIQLWRSSLGGIGRSRKAR